MYILNIYWTYRRLLTSMNVPFVNCSKQVILYIRLSKKQPAYTDLTLIYETQVFFPPEEYIVQAFEEHGR